MKQKFEWLKDTLDIHIQMSVTEVFTITACIFMLLVIAIILIAHL